MICSLLSTVYNWFSIQKSQKHHWSQKALFLKYNIKKLFGGIIYVHCIFHPLCVVNLKCRSLLFPSSCHVCCIGWIIVVNNYCWQKLLKIGVFHSKSKIKYVISVFGCNCNNNNYHILCFGKWLLADKKEDSLCFQELHPCVRKSSFSLSLYLFPQSKPHTVSWDWKFISGHFVGGVDNIPSYSPVEELAKLSLSL